MLRRLTCAALGVFLLADPLARSVAVQILDPPPRSTRRPAPGARTVDPNRTHTELTLSAAALGGWDDDVLPSGGLATPLGLETSAYVGVASTTIRLWRGRANRSVELSGRGVTTAYPGVGLGPITGGGIQVNGSLNARRRTHIQMRASARYDATFSLSAFGAIARQVDSGVVTDPDPTRGITEDSSIVRDLGATLTHGWNARHRTELRSDFGDRDFVTGMRRHFRTGSGSVSHNWDFSRTAGVSAAYRYLTERSQAEASHDMPLQRHGGELGLEIRRAVSRTRTMTFRGGAGAMRVATFSFRESRPFDYTSPVGYGSARMDVGRTWAVSGDYRRDVTVLEGLSLHEFITDAASLTLGGDIGSRFGAMVSTAYSVGRGSADESDSYEAMSSTIQLQALLSSWCAAVFSYGHYNYHLRGISILPSGLPARLQRNSIRIGMTMALPLHDTARSN